jgi:Transposase IS66 family
LLDQIRNHILAMSKTVLPKSAAGQACNCALSIWTRITGFLDYPQLELSTNLAENSMRPIGLGRSNWIHIGSEQAARVGAECPVGDESIRTSLEKLPVADVTVQPPSNIAELEKPSPDYQPVRIVMSR